MIRKPSQGLFITGTDTEVGKTYVAALIAKALLEQGRRVGVYKPAASGCRHDGNTLVSDDALALWKAAGRPGELSAVCPQLFAAPLAPHLAAEAEGRQIDARRLRTGVEYWHDRCEIVLVEGAGGLMSPLGQDEYVADLVHDLGYPLVVVVPNQLGVINQTLQTLITAATFRTGLEIAGVVLNNARPPRQDPSTSSNYQELQARCVPPILAQVGWQAESLTENVDWLKLAYAASQQRS